MYKTVIVHLDDTEGCSQRVRYAATLAQAHDGHLTGAYVLRKPVIPTYGELQMAPAAWTIEEQLVSAQEEAAAAQERFKEALREFDLSNEWSCLEGVPAELLSDLGRSADLVVLGRGDKSVGGPFAGMTEDVVMGAGCPVLMLPEANGTNSVTVPKRVLVAWNGSRESARAINDALPILKQAEEIQVVFADVDAGDELSQAQEHVRKHLLRHGVEAQITNMESGSDGTGELVGELLLSLAPGKGYELLVMGAYGHTRLREFVLGGVTRYVLRQLSVPVLMSH